MIFIEIYFWIKSRDNWVCEICQFDAQLGWTTIPNKTVTNGGVTYTTNSMGFRSDEVDTSKDHILIVGDSVAFGSGVNDDETVSSYLGQLTKGYQVLNLAVPGYSIDQYYLTLKKHIAAINPKLVIVIIFTGNDWQETGWDNMFGVSKPFFGNSIDGELSQTNKNISEFSCNNIFSRSWAVRKFSLGNLREYVCKPRQLDHASTEKVIGALVKRIHGLSHKFGANSLFVLSPTLGDFLLTTCGPGTNFSFCESNVKNFPEYVFKNTEKFQKYILEKVKKEKKNDPVNYAKKSAHVGTWALYLRFKNLFKDSSYRFVDYQNELMSKGVFPIEFYNKDDPYHYSPKGNKFLADIIRAHIEPSLAKS